MTTKATKPEVINCPVYLCVTTCFIIGKRWFAGARYVFNHEPPRNLKRYMTEVGKVRKRMIPSDELQFEVVGREPRPSEYTNEYLGEIEEEVG